MKALLCIAALVAVSGCASVSYSTLEEAETALRDSTLSAEDREATEEWIERFEKDVERAEHYFLVRESCNKAPGHAWVCRDRERYDSRRPPRELEDKVKVYRSDRATCGCTADVAGWLKNL